LVFAVVTPDGVPGNVATYDSAFGAPICNAEGSYCSSGNLLERRGTIDIGETNEPNTVDSCNGDGDVGTYKNDESIEAIKVRTLDGMAMAVGKAVGNLCQYLGLVKWRF